MDPQSTPKERASRKVVSLVVRSPGRAGEVLLVQRPEDDPDLPGVWGLPAGRIHEGENRPATVRRIGLEKLGVRLDPGPVLNRGWTARTTYRLEMEIVEAWLAAGEPSVPQARSGVTQYTQWRWGIARDLEPAADLGSLCCRLFLEAEAPDDPAGA